MSSIPVNQPAESKQEHEEVRADAVEADDDAAPKRIFTAEEREAMLAAQSEEEALAKREAAELAATQKALTAQITGRNVQFTPANVSGSENSSLESLSIGSSAASSSSVAEISEYEHSSHLIPVLLIEEHADFFAPLIATFIRKYESHTLLPVVCYSAIAAAAAAASPASGAESPSAPAVVKPRPLDSLVVDIADFLEVPTLTNGQRVPLVDIVKRDDKHRFAIVITLDAHSKKVLDEARPSMFDDNKRLHSAFPRPEDEVDSKAVLQTVQTFVENLPDLLSFYV